MEQTDEMKPATEAASDNSDSGGWSANEFDGASPERRDSRERGPLGLSDDQLRTAGLSFGIIILVFAGLGIWLAQYLPEKGGTDFLNCVHIANSDERLSCYDKAAVGAAAPFKGGAPFSTYSRSDLATSG